MSELQSLLPGGAASSSALAQGSRSWKLGLAEGRLLGEIDGAEALRQSVLVALSTPRYAYSIFSGQFGHELDSLLGKDYDYLCAVAPALIADALLPDSRVDGVEGFSFERLPDGAAVRFTVRSDGETLAAEQLVKGGAV